MDAYQQAYDELLNDTEKYQEIYQIAFEEAYKQMMDETYAEAFEKAYNRYRFVYDHLDAAPYYQLDYRHAGLVAGQDYWFYP